MVITCKRKCGVRMDEAKQLVHDRKVEEIHDEEYVPGMVTQF